MENNNEIMNNNEEVIETATEEIVKAASNGGMKKATTIGLAMIAVACKVTKSPWCLMGLVLIPTFHYNSSERRK